MLVVYIFRLLNDLLLWEPAAPIPKDVPEPYSLGCGVSWSPEFVPQLMQHGNIDDDLTFSTSGDGYGKYSTLRYLVDRVPIFKLEQELKT